MQPAAPRECGSFCRFAASIRNSPTVTRMKCRAASASASGSPALLPWNPNSSSATRPSRRSMCRYRLRLSISSRICANASASPICSSPMTCRSFGISASASRSCISAASSSLRPATSSSTTRFTLIPRHCWRQCRCPIRQSRQSAFFGRSRARCRARSIRPRAASSTRAARSQSSDASRIGPNCASCARATGSPAARCDCCNKGSNEQDRGIHADKPIAAFPHRRPHIGFRDARCGAIELRSHLTRHPERRPCRSLIPISAVGWYEQLPSAGAVSEGGAQRAMNDPDDDTAAPDDWVEFREDEGEPICVEELKRLNLEDMPEDIHISVMDNYFPDTTIWCAGDRLICEIEEHLYTKYWEHKFSAYAFADAMERAVRRLRHEGHPFFEPSREDDDVHIFVRWQLRLPRSIQAQLVPDSIKSAFDLVWHRADSILENSDSVLILGKDSGAALDRLKTIGSKL